MLALNRQQLHGVHYPVHKFGTALPADNPVETEPPELLDLPPPDTAQCRSVTLAFCLPYGEV